MSKMLDTNTAFELLKHGVLKKGTKVKMSSLAGFSEFTEIDDAYIKKARPMELEDDWVVVTIKGKIYSAEWIDAIEGYDI
jgi:hypothetical protein